MNTQWWTYDKEDHLLIRSTLSRKVWLIKLSSKTFYSIITANYTKKFRENVVTFEVMAFDNIHILHRRCICQQDLWIQGTMLIPTYFVYITFHQFIFNPFTLYSHALEEFPERTEMI